MLSFLNGLERSGSEFQLRIKQLRSNVEICRATEIGQVEDGFQPIESQLGSARAEISSLREKTVEQPLLSDFVTSFEDMYLFEAAQLKEMTAILQSRGFIAHADRRAELQARVEKVAETPTEDDEAEANHDRNDDEDEEEETENTIRVNDTPAVTEAAPVKQAAPATPVQVNRFSTQDEDDLLKTPSLEDFGLAGYKYGSKPAFKSSVGSVSLSPAVVRTNTDTSIRSSMSTQDALLGDLSIASPSPNKPEPPHFSASAKKTPVTEAHDSNTSDSMFPHMQDIQQEEFNGIASFIQSQVPLHLANQYISNINDHVTDKGFDGADRLDLLTLDELSSIIKDDAKTKAAILLLKKVGRLKQVKTKAGNCYKITSE